MLLLLSKPTHVMKLNIFVSFSSVKAKHSKRKLFKDLNPAEGNGPLLSLYGFLVKNDLYFESLANQTQCNHVLYLSAHTSVPHVIHESVVAV